MIDLLSLALRALAFVVVLQSAGLALFKVGFRSVPQADGDRSWRQVQTLMYGCAVGGVLLTLLQQFLEPVRLADDFSGIADFSLQRLTWLSSAGAAAGMRLLGLSLIATAAHARQWSRPRTALLGAVLVCGSFLFIGHTSVHVLRSWLAPLLMLHLLIASLWFGALWPLYFAGKQSASLVAELAAKFSAVALWLVPLIAVAGVSMAVMLLPDWQALSQPYGWLLIAKALGFALLMGLASVNKWRLSPRLHHGEAAVRQRFQQVLLIEYGLIVLVLIITAVLTGRYSPQ